LINRESISFGAYIRQLRVSRKVPLRKIAAELDIDPSTLGKIERNKRNPSAEMIIDLARIYQVDHTELMVKHLSDKISDELKHLSFGRHVLKIAEIKIDKSENRKS
jgi:transcriptional regulator with XRE-family HTH domain